MIAMKCFGENSTTFFKAVLRVAGTTGRRRLYAADRSELDGRTCRTPVSRNQLTLTFLDAPPPQLTLSDQLDAAARIEAVRILARIIAQAIETAERMEATHE
jgi:hypothetical protein